MEVSLGIRISSRCSTLTLKDVVMCIPCTVGEENVDARILGPFGKQSSGGHGIGWDGCLHGWVVAGGRQLSACESEQSTTSTNV